MHDTTHIFREAARISDAGERAALVVVTETRGHTPQVPGAKMIVRQDGTMLGTVGGGRFEHVIAEHAAQVMRTGKATTVSYKLKAELGMCCGGEMQVYIEPLVAADRLILFGAGHVAQPTATVAHLCGFRVVVVDERSEWNTSDRFPTAFDRKVLHHGDFLATFRFQPDDSILIVTHNHDYDQELVAACLDVPHRYLGMIGSARKVESAYARLRRDGVPDEKIKTIFAPVGLDIAAETPEEIAVAIVGELIRVRRATTTTKQTKGATVHSCTHRG
ncbi:MAG: XdhC family protein [Myxococcales bacterium]|nr:XdhC family protein [Myxococcales bacterium]